MPVFQIPVGLPSLERGGRFKKYMFSFEKHTVQAARCREQLGRKPSFTSAGRDKLVILSQTRKKNERDLATEGIKPNPTKQTNQFAISSSDLSWKSDTFLVMLESSHLFSSPQKKMIPVKKELLACYVQGVPDGIA